MDTNKQGYLKMVGKILEFVRDESGATAVEYGLIAALVSVSGIGALTLMGDSLNDIFQTVGDLIGTAATAAASEPKTTVRRVSRRLRCLTTGSTVAACEPVAKVSCGKSWRAKDLSVAPSVNLSSCSAT